MPPTESTPPPPTYQPQRFHVWLDTDGEPAYHLVTVTHADRLNAEDQAASRGISLKRNPMQSTTMWVFHAMVRTHDTERRWDDFKASVLDMQGVDDDEADAGEADVPLDPSTS